MNVSELYPDNLDEDQRLKVQLVVSLVLNQFDGGAWKKAMEIWEEQKLTAEEEAACFLYFDSMQRAFLKGEDRKYLREFWQT